MWLKDRKIIILLVLVIIVIGLAFVIIHRYERAKNRIFAVIEATPEDTIKPKEITQTPEYKKMGLHYLNAEKFHFQENKITEALKELRTGLQLADSIYEKAIGLFYDRIALCFLDSCLEDSAIYYSDLAIRANNYFYEQLGKSYYNRAVILKRFYHIKEAIEYYEKAYYQFCSRQSNVYAAATAAELAVLYEALGDYKKARQYRFVIYGLQLYEERDE